jgi:hypothetical protein
MKLQTAQKIRSLYNSGQSVRTISKQFGISRSYCYQILRNEVCFDVFYKPQTLKTKVDVDAAWQLMTQHKTQAQIAHELSTDENRISPSLVGYHLRRRWEEERA